MGAPPNSQAAPLPKDLPFRLVSRTIGCGAYAFIRKAVPLQTSSPIIAIKFINKHHAFTTGRLKPAMLNTEISLHRYLGKHRNIIEYYTDGESDLYRWIGMELADNGDLFDKIEADVGVGEDIAHLYFHQLMSAVGYMHGKGVAHRDLKPENILVGGNGDLKLADFGLAALFRKAGVTRTCNTVCGSPPYIAPEVVMGRRAKRTDTTESGYLPDTSDIWSCGVILFTLLVGNTPWDEPTKRSTEFEMYVASGGKVGDELWENLPKNVLSLLRGMLKLDPQCRFTLEEVKTHPWMTRRNPLMDLKGRAKDPVALATQMMQNLKVDLAASTSPARHCHTKSNSDAMDVDNEEFSRMALTQPETPVTEMAFDWEASNSQPTRSRAGNAVALDMMDYLKEDPALSQFTQQPTVPLTLTQNAKKYGDIVPATALTTFVSSLPGDLLVSNVLEALQRLNIPANAMTGDDRAVIRIKTLDGRQQGMTGSAVISQYNNRLFEVRFLKSKGDPLEWRRFFKNVCVYCKDAIVKPDQL